ncbi:MAG: putative lipopolysaccharide heptosyltransferase III [Chlamydiae bacterium]|nr:putative lipopolysaccharide heptosyltransferase III [Chlamydiota bacterium]
MSYGKFPDLGSVKKILLIKLRHLGDVVLSSPLITHLKKVFPDAEIHAYLYKDTYPMLEGHEAISKFFLYDKNWKKMGLLKRFYHELRLLREIKKEGYDLTINLTEGDRGAIVSLISGSKIKVGFDPEGQGFKGKEKIYTHLVKNCPTPRHAVERNLDALRRIGIFPEEDERELSFYIPEIAFAQVKQILQSKNIPIKNYVVIHPTSRWRFKCPPISFFVSLIHEFLRLERKIILVSGPDQEEQKIVQEIERLVGEKKVVNLSGKLSIKELGALLYLCNGLICVDSMVLHMASALKTPVVALFGPTSEQNWGPWNHFRSRVIAQDWPCRPCLLDGCGGSKRSDCLHVLSPHVVVEAYEEVSSGSNLDFSLNSLATLLIE